MTLSLLEYSPVCQNQRVAGYEIPSDEQPRIYTTDNLLAPAEMDVLIQSAYRQIFNEQQLLASHRQRALESQLRFGQITVKQFIHGLATCDSFRRLNYESNNNYRFVQMCLQRLLGRDAYSDREKLSWSIVLATKGLPGFINDLLNSEEYQATFGEHTVPYQRRRILPQHVQGDLPFARMARYGTDYRDKLPQPSQSWRLQRGADGLFGQFEPFNWQMFVRRANWSTVSALLILTIVAIGFLLITTTVTNGTIP